ncbi:hypothetical protein [Mucilaginibacter antarcticus]|uniref:hypothetical protein n=1 Tax=Mucilaginibacter antarcticus TaxID=1855725 RepID=UPI00363E396E
MAHLEVEPKKSNPLLWIILGLVALAILFFLFKGCGKENAGTATTTDTTSSTTVDTSSRETVAATQPDWSKVDFNSPEITDADITDKDVSVRGNDDYTIYSLGEDILLRLAKTPCKAMPRLSLNKYRLRWVIALKALL